MINIGNFIRNSSGKFITVTFKKKDGTTRKLNGRIGVTRFIKDGGKLQEETAKYYLLWEVKTRNYRYVNKYSIFSVTCEGVTVHNNLVEA